MIDKALRTSKSCEWSTPQWLFDQLHAKYKFTLDPCATPENAKCAKYFTKKQNGLEQYWGDERVFMNPPYGKEIYEWMAKCVEAVKYGALVVCLVPARTDTLWWHRYAMQGKIEFLRGRLSFQPGKRAPFPSAIVVFEPYQKFLPAIVIHDHINTRCHGRI